MIYDLQKASLLKRLSAAILDFILILILAVGAAFALSAITGYDRHMGALDAIYGEYEAQMGLSLYPTEEEYNAFTEEQKATYESTLTAISTDERCNYLFDLLFNLTVVITTCGILIAYLISEFLVPLLFGNGQTVGKKIFGIGVMRVDGVRMSSVQLFVRTVLGKYTVETMIPVYLIIMMVFGQAGIAILIIPGLLIFEIAVLCITNTNSLIHDMFAGTVTVDLSSQLIFDSPEALLAYKKKIHEEQAASADYP